MDEPCWDRAPARFVSCFYFQLKVAQADDIITDCHPDEIKASDKGTVREAQQGASGESASHTRHSLHWLPPRDLRMDPS